MTIEAINEQLLRAIGVGVAILDRDDLTLHFANDTFTEWFENAAPGDKATEILPDLDAAELTATLDAGGRYAVEMRVRRKRRTLVIAASFTATEATGRRLIVLECGNITRIHELESMIDSYASMVERNTRDLQREKERVEKLLLNIMPRSVYDEYKTFGVVTPQKYEPVSVLMLDFVGFTEISTRLDPTVTVSELNDIYSAFDRIGEQFGCERIKTVGDAYIAVAGMPEPTPDHARAVANAALRFVRYLQRRNESHPQRWDCRIGLATGAVVGSVVGIQKYVYDVFGPAVNLASRLQDRAPPNQIMVHDVMRDTLIEEFALESQGVMNLRGFGEMEVLRLVDAAPAGASAPRPGAP